MIHIVYVAMHICSFVKQCSDLLNWVEIVALFSVKEINSACIRAHTGGDFWHAVGMRSLVKLTFGLARRVTGTNGSSSSLEMRTVER